MPLPDHFGEGRSADPAGQDALVVASAKSTRRPPMGSGGLLRDVVLVATVELPRNVRIGYSAACSFLLENQVKNRPDDSVQLRLFRRVRALSVLDAAAGEGDPVVHGLEVSGKVPAQ